MGVELEAYTIQIPQFRVRRRIAFPRQGLGESGERFGRDATIGTEYNSRPFATLREGLFLLKAGLRKYNRDLYRSRSASRVGRRLLLVGGWRDRYAGAHVHLSVAGHRLTRQEARQLAYHLHDHIPLLVAMGANSPVWADELTEVASNRILNASRIYFHVTRRAHLTSRSFDEMLYSPGRALKPPTLEVRVLDSNLPEYVLAAAACMKAVALAWLARKPATNHIAHSDYLASREHAARDGMAARLCWNGTWMPATRCLARFLAAYRAEMKQLELPEDVALALEWLGRGVDGGTLIAAAARRAQDEAGVDSGPSDEAGWQRLFAQRYVAALDHILSGHSLRHFARALQVDREAGTR
jgi:hypothetical protein